MSNLYKIFPFFLLYLISSQVYSQSFVEKDTVVIFPVKTWVVGLNIQLFSDLVTEDLFGGDSLKAPKIEFLARRNYAYNQAIRVRVFGSYQFFSRQSTLGWANFPFRKDYYSAVGLALGHEWQFRISEKWFGNYGIEVESQLEYRKKSKDEAYFLSGNNLPRRRYDEQIWSFSSVSGLPFFGFGYEVTKRLIFTAEAKIIGSYQWGKTEFKESIRLDDPQMSIPIPPPEKYQDDVITKEWRFYIKPYTGVFINYRF